MSGLSQPSLTRNFANDERGVVAMMFGLMFLVFAFVAGIAVDFGRLTNAKSQVSGAVDSAALAAGRALLDGRMTDAEIEQMAKDYFSANVNQGGTAPGAIGEPVVVVNRATGEVSITVDTTVQMSLTKLVGYTDVTFPVNSATIFEQRDIELGMALDVTGSMGGQKIQDLKLAAKDLVDILLPDSGQANKVRIGLAPYAASVNGGVYADVVTGQSSGNNCVHERGGSERFTDAEPVGAARLNKKSGMSCPSATVMAMTDNKAVLKSTIDTYSTGGMTAGHLGAAWAWYLVSPEWKDIWPSPSEPVAYNSSNTTKAVILMTDGVFNQQYVGSNGNSANQARAVCAEMKAKGVAVYAVAFQAPSSAQDLLKECSTSDSYYFPADNGDELRLAFQKIALKLNNLRLTN